MFSVFFFFFFFFNSQNRLFAHKDKIYPGFISFTLNLEISKICLPQTFTNADNQISYLSIVPLLFAVSTKDMSLLCLIHSNQMQNVGVRDCSQGSHSCCQSRICGNLVKFYLDKPKSDPSLEEMTSFFFQDVGDHGSPLPLSLLALNVLFLCYFLQAMFCHPLAKARHVCHALLSRSIYPSIHP